MAKLRMGIGIGSLSGRTGNAVFASTPGGVVLRQRPVYTPHPTSAQETMGRYLAIANRAWRDLSAAQAEAWRGYARRNAFRDPRTGLMRVPAAPHLFVGLSVKYLQVHGGFTAPLDPPEGVFLGDVGGVALAMGGPRLRVTADAANREGVLTELLTQRLSGRNNSTRPRSYKSQGFRAFTGPGDSALVGLSPGTWAAAVRFVEASSGRATGLIEVGRADITTWE